MWVSHFSVVWLVSLTHKYKLANLFQLVSILCLAYGYQVLQDPSHFKTFSPGTPSTGSKWHFAIGIRASKRGKGNSRRDSPEVFRLGHLQQARSFHQRTLL